MPFKLNFHPQQNYGCIEQKFISRIDAGDELKVIPVSAEKAYPPQPSAENFTLDAQLRAGVPLSYVDCALLEVPDKVSQQQLAELNEDLEKLEQIDAQ